MELKPDIFANGGDRKLDNIPEVPRLRFDRLQDGL